MRIRFLAIAGVALAACVGNSHDKPPNAPNQPPYASPGATLTSAEIPQTPQEEQTVGGEGYGGTTEYGATNGVQGAAQRGGDAGSIMTDPISR